MVLFFQAAVFERVGYFQLRRTTYGIAFLIREKQSRPLIKHSMLRIEGMVKVKKGHFSQSHLSVPVPSLASLCYYIGFTGLVRALYIILVASITFQCSYPCAVCAAPGGFVTGKGSLPV